MEIEALSAELAGIVGGANVVPMQTFAPEEGAADWPAPPLRVVLPNSVDETAAVVRACEAAGAALVVVGGGTQLHTGYPPRQDKPYLLLSTKRMNRILDYQPDDMTVTCEPGVTLAALAQTLAARRQFLPIDAPLGEWATVGGVVSANQTGFRRAMYGTPRDLVIGVRAVMTGGTQIKGGGKVVKNVAGYDVCKLFTGAWGTAGALVEITFKVYPLPEDERLLRLPAPDLEAAARAGLILHHAQLAPVALLATNTANEREDDPTACLFVWLQGKAARMDWQTTEIGRRAGECGLGAAAVLPVSALDALRTRQAGIVNTRLSARASCLPSDVAPLCARLQGLPDVRIIADCALGIVQVAAHEPTPALVSALTGGVPDTANLLWTRLNASLRERPDLADLLADVNVWGSTSRTALLQRALKQSIDPHDTFSPGRFVGRI